jgi:phosphate-selective porin OprO/OprP
MEASRLVGPTPTFFGGYAEVGWYITGETRGYRNGAFDRTRVLRPLSAGGPGAFQVNLRYDRLDLSDAGVTGGSQNAYLASLIWIPSDYTLPPELRHVAIASFRPRSRPRLPSTCSAPLFRDF